MREYFCNVKIGRKTVCLGPFESHDAARDAGFAAYPKASTVQTGYGYHGSLDMRWHKPE